MAIKFIDVSYKNLFKKVNVEIDKGQIVSVVGANNSGKTNFFNLIFGVDLNFKGKIKICKRTIDESIKTKQIKDIRENIFYLRQDYYNQLFNISILEDIKFYISNFDKTVLNELLKSFGLENSVLNKHYTELSNGEIKKIVLIIMLLSNRKILLLDDVCSGLDYKGKKMLIKQLKKIKREDKIIIISSCDTDFLMEITDKIIYIYKGNLMLENNKYKFFEDQSILNKCNMSKPKILEFKEIVLKRKNIKLLYRDNVNDLIKDIYRNAK